MLRRIAKILLVFMILWLPLQGQAMSQVASKSDETVPMTAMDHHEGCHASDNQSDDMSNLSGDCHDMNHCQLCHTALGTFLAPLATNTSDSYFSLSDIRPPHYFFEQPQRPPLG